MPQIASEARKGARPKEPIPSKLDSQPAQNGILHVAQLLGTQPAQFSHQLHGRNGGNTLRVEAAFLQKSHGDRNLESRSPQGGGVGNKSKNLPILRTRAAQNQNGPGLRRQPQIRLPDFAPFRPWHEPRPRRTCGRPIRRPAGIPFPPHDPHRLIFSSPYAPVLLLSPASGFGARTSAHSFYE